MSENNDVPVGKEYRGPSGVARNSVWLTNEDIPHDRETIVTIESVIRRDNVKFQEGRELPVVLSLRFVGKKRELRVNAGHRAILAKLFGEGDTACSHWFGKSIALYVEQGVRSPKGIGPAVRIRAKRIVPPTNAQAATSAEPASDNIDAEFDREASRAISPDEKEAS